MWLEHVADLFRRTHRQWRLYDGTYRMECFITDCEGMSAEIRFDYRGEEYHRFVHATRLDAEREAQEKREQLTLLGWSERPADDQADPYATPCER